MLRFSSAARQWIGAADRRIDPVDLLVWINSNSAALTCACSSGLSRAMTYQTNPTTMPIAAQNQNEALHPWLLMIHVRTGMLRPAPAPTPANIHPFALPRSATGIHWETN